MTVTVLPLGMVCDIINCLHHNPHELHHVEGVVGELWMVSKCGMMTLRERGVKTLSTIYICVFRLNQMLINVKKCYYNVHYAVCV